MIIFVQLVDRIEPACLRKRKKKEEKRSLIPFIHRASVELLVVLIMGTAMLKSGEACGPMTLKASWSILHIFGPNQN
jgi:hypothetical protein